jgi:hypothetical protein
MKWKCNSIKVGRGLTHMESATSIQWILGWAAGMKPRCLGGQRAKRGTDVHAKSFSFLLFSLEALI